MKGKFWLYKKTHALRTQVWNTTEGHRPQNETELAAVCLAKMCNTAWVCRKLFQLAIEPKNRKKLKTSSFEQMLTQILQSGVQPASFVMFVNPRHVFPVYLRLCSLGSVLAGSESLAPDSPTKYQRIHEKETQCPIFSWTLQGSAILVMHINSRCHAH